VPSAELPVEDLDVEALAHSSLSAFEEGGNGFSRRRSERANDSGWRCLVGCERLTVDDQALARQSREVGRRHGRCMLARLGPGMRDHKEARVDCILWELPRGPVKQDFEAVDDVALKQTRTVVWLALDELAGRVGTRQIDDMKAAGPGARSTPSVGPRTITPPANGSM